MLLGNDLRDVTFLVYGVSVLISFAGFDGNRLMADWKIGRDSKGEGVVVTRVS
jgi:hypothetical protein